MPHVCNRENCPPVNIAGPRASCMKCNVKCFLLCYGAEKSSSGLVRFKMPSGLTIYVEAMKTQFACPTCVSEGNVNVQTTMKLTEKTSTSNNVTSEVTNDNLVEILKEGFSDLKNHIDENIGKCVENNKQVVTELSETMNKAAKMYETPIKQINRPLYSTMLKKNKIEPKASGMATPTSMKRKRNMESSGVLALKEKKSDKGMASANIPAAKMGTKDVLIGLKPQQWVPKPNRKPIEAKNIMKSVRISGLHPAVSVDQLSDYITANTPLTDKSKFFCQTLVKKDQDLKAYTFISFKVDVAPEDFESVMNLNYWPNYVTIREFIRINKPKQRGSLFDDDMRPNKLQRKNEDGVEATKPLLNSSTTETRNVEGMELGFR